MTGLPDSEGHFGRFGGRFVSETLIPALEELTLAYERWRADDEFVTRLDADLAHYVGRPSPIYHAERLSAHCGGAR
ncbi:MAG TPA: tryptophan synthase subunit beta, partial [Xanthomonadales bacterium]|nr:tryptophan synthase subunit beta [Xanthomonadales bacterium]